MPPDLIVGPDLTRGWLTGALHITAVQISYSRLDQAETTAEELPDQKTATDRQTVERDPAIHRASPEPCGQRILSVAFRQSRRIDDGRGGRMADHNTGYRRR